MIVVSYATSSCQPNLMSLINHESLTTGNKGGPECRGRKAQPSERTKCKEYRVAWVNGRASRPTQSESASGCGQPELSLWLTNPYGVRPRVTVVSKQSNERPLHKKMRVRLQGTAQHGERLGRY
jgi:hypothetical protein